MIGRDADALAHRRTSSHPRRAPLVIDPTIVYSTYQGSSGFDEGRAIAVDANGAAYVAGMTRYSDFPTTPGAYQPTFRGGTGNTPSDAFVAKINAAGTQFEYVTYLGGSGNDEASGIAVDASGSAYVTGSTESADFPSTSSAYRSAIGISHHDGFLTKLNPSGSALVYSTFLGSSAPTNPAAIAVDAQGFAYIVGSTWATNLPRATFPKRRCTGRGRRRATRRRRPASSSRRPTSRWRPDRSPAPPITWTRRSRRPPARRTRCGCACRR